MSRPKAPQIYYAGLSEDYSHIGDRRRFAHYCQSRDIELSRRQDLSDIIVATPLSNLQNLLETRRPHQKIVLDIVDGYLSERFAPIKDIGRGMLRSGFNLRALKGFQKTLLEFISECDAVIVASPEQKLLVEEFNSNVHTILDCHLEIPLLLARDNSYQSDRQKIFWEGQSSNIKHIASYASQFLSVFEEMELAIITNLIHYRLADRFLPKSSKLHLQNKISRDLRSRVEVISWSIRNLVNVSKSSRFGLIPIDRDDTFAQAKPENKLLIMWRLGLPTFVSPTPSYIRVLSELGLNHYNLETLNLAVNGRESILDVLARWLYDKEVVLEYLNQTHSCEILNKKWDLAINSVS